MWGGKEVSVSLKKDIDVQSAEDEVPYKSSPPFEPMRRFTQHPPKARKKVHPKGTQQHV